jgi:hypothetical protein
LGFSSKYMIVIFVPTALLWILMSRQWKRIDWRWMPLLILSGAIMSLPVFIWNMQHDWASFRFQLGHGLQSEAWDWTWPLEYLVGQILILFPTTIWCVLRQRKGQRGGKAPGFLLYFALAPLLFFFLTSFRAHVEANWPIMAHPAFLTLAFFAFTGSRLRKATLAIWILAHVLVFTEVIHHWLPVDPTQLKTYEFVHFDGFLPRASESVSGGSDVYLGSYQAASFVSYKLRRQIYKLDGTNRKDFYDFVPESHPKHDRFLFGCETLQGLPEWAIKAGYHEVKSTKISDEFRWVEVERVAQAPDR